MSNRTRYQKSSKFTRFESKIYDVVSKTKHTNGYLRKRKPTKCLYPGNCV